MKKQLAVEGGAPVITSPLPSIKDKSGRLIGKEEFRYVEEVLSSGTLAYIYGDKVRRFEEDFAGLIGTTNAVAVSSGTAALHTAMIYLNPDPGDEIIVSPITDMGSVIPILYQQAIPVFTDIDPLNQNMAPGMIEEKITSRTKAIMVTHIYGSPADMDPIMKIAEKHGLFVIEDCAQAHLTEYHGRKVGTIGHIGAFSFQQSKHITTGDGGMVVASEDERFGRGLRQCFDKGWPRHLKGRNHYFLAPNYHMTELQAAVGLAQITRYEQCIEARRIAAEHLTGCLAEEDAIQPLGCLPDCRPTHFYYCFRIELDKLSVDGAAFVEALEAEGLPCELGYPGPIPLYLYPVIREKKTFGTSGWPFDSPATDKKWEFEEGLCPLAERACRETIILPWNEGLSREHANKIGEAIIKVSAAYRR